MLMQKVPVLLVLQLVRLDATLQVLSGLGEALFLLFWFHFAPIEVHHS